MAKPFRFYIKILILATCPIGSNIVSTEAYGSKDDTIITQVKFYASKILPAVSVTVEVPKTPQEFERGLMFRKSMPKDHGMLFMFETPRILRFWMHNTYLSLDMIFLDEKRRVLWIEENTTPLDETPLGPDEPAKYVVEVIAGFVREHRIKVGTQAKFVYSPKI